MRRPADAPLKAFILAMEYTPNVAGGVGTYVYELANGLVRAGCQVTVLAYTPGEATVLSHPHLTVHLIPPSQASFTTASHGSLVQGILGFNEDLTRHGRALLAQERPDILHFHQW